MPRSRRRYVSYGVMRSIGPELVELASRLRPNNAAQPIRPPQAREPALGHPRQIGSSPVHGQRDKSRADCTLNQPGQQRQHEIIVRFLRAPMHGQPGFCDQIDEHAVALASDPFDDCASGVAYGGLRLEPDSLEQQDGATALGCPPIRCHAATQSSKPRLVPGWPRSLMTGEGRGGDLLTQVPDPQCRSLTGLARCLTTLRARVRLCDLASFAGGR
jgi:hypothetical protein